MTWWTTWCTWWMIWWCDKRVKDKVKQARRAKRDMVGIVDMMVVDIEDDMVDNK